MQRTSAAASAMFFVLAAAAAAAHPGRHHGQRGAGTASHLPVRSRAAPVPGLVGARAHNGRQAFERLAERQAFERVVDEFLAFHFWANPTRATQLGIHDYDGRLPDLSREGVQAAADAYHGWRERLRGIDRSRLTGDAYWDYEILEHAIGAELLELEEVRGWERNPLLYVTVIMDGLSALAAHEFAPVAERLGAVLGRERQIPALLAEARRNLANPPPIYTRLAIERADAALAFLRKAVPLAFQGALIGAAEREFRAVNDAAMAALEEFIAYLRDDLLPRSGGDFRLGSDLFERTMRLEQYVDLPVGEILALSDREIQRYRAWIQGEARRLDPGRAPAEVIGSIARDHAPADSLLELARQAVLRAKEFVGSRQVVTAHEAQQLVVRAMPPYHVGSYASLLAPGPFEPRAAEAYYEIALPDAGWAPESVEQHLAYLNRSELVGITIHETFPGRFVQLLALREAPGRVRKAFAPPSLAEGWAHYVEEMMLDQGFAESGARLRIVQLRRALQHLARVRAGILMHTRGAGVEDAARELADIAFLEPFRALRDAERGTYDPLYGQATLGKWQILKLRYDYQRYLQRQGESYSLRLFHDRLLATGAPISVARKILMPGDTAQSLE